MPPSSEKSSGGFKMKHFLIIRLGMMFLAISLMFFGCGQTINDPSDVPQPTDNEEDMGISGAFI
jgi:hypothetical protein